jgi:hypothetical protein
MQIQIPYNGQILVAIIKTIGTLVFNRLVIELHNGDSESLVYRAEMYGYFLRFGDAGKGKRLRIIERDNGMTLLDMSIRGLLQNVSVTKGGVNFITKIGNDEVKASIA